MTDGRSVSERIVRASEMANRAFYNADATDAYQEGAPHLKHPDLRQLYAQSVIELVDHLRDTSARVLDVGAGEGAATIPLLEFGCKVTAIDVSPTQLEQLRATCAEYDGLRTICADAHSAIKELHQRGESFEGVVMLSVLHHFPDYGAVIREAADLIAPKGVFFTFQDPLPYSSLPVRDRVFSGVAYYSWRILQGDIVRGVGRWLRRKAGVYLEDSVEDNAEYHVVRGGVDNVAIVQGLREMGFETRTIRYFSTQSSLWQRLGTKLRFINTFAVIAWRP